ncbi:hypothetical protein B9G55_14870 [Saccharibacillus sp. O16]|nr:hypothetical protein B9G55_14870 [Saccharibacillus sp. O16]
MRSNSTSADLDIPYRHLHILGASGSGATTLGQALGQHLPHGVLDGDDYFWAHKFDKIRPLEERQSKLKAELERRERWLLSGAVCGWGDLFKSYFDFVIFLYVPPEDRLSRLRDREMQRYGADILPGGTMYEQSQEFLDWAAGYDQAGEETRSLKLHEHWMADLSCPILRIEGMQSTEERVRIVLEALRSPSSL